MTIDELRPYNGFRIAVTTRSGNVYPGVLHIDASNAVRILQGILSDRREFAPDDIVAIEHRGDLGWPVSNAGPEETEAAAALLRPHLERRVRLEYAERSEVGVVSISAEHGWVLLPGTVVGRTEGTVITIDGLKAVHPV